ncbi:hypothetical protein PFISCL1PPCAC_9498, partial [Pristionchus fissidentatus]
HLQVLRLAETVAANHRRLDDHASCGQIHTCSQRGGGAQHAQDSRDIGSLNVLPLIMSESRVMPGHARLDAPFQCLLTFTFALLSYHLNESLPLGFAHIPHLLGDGFRNHHRHILCILLRGTEDYGRVARDHL